MRCCNFSKKLNEKDNPTFLLKVCVRSDNLLSYEIRRSYADFVDFDIRIRRRQPTHNLILPLDDFTVGRQRSESVADSRTLTNDSIESSSSENKNDNKNNRSSKSNENKTTSLTESFYSMVQRYMRVPANLFMSLL